ncbi:MAG: hypothetical protein KF752_01655 [Pirellulaceae bacterium]|nr:hypothetical protein [Pirellulaceae bacterium]
MLTPIRRFVSFAVILGGCALSAPALGQLYRPYIGYDDLVAEYGVSLATGAGIRVFMPEGPTGDGSYMPNTGLAEFTGKTFTNGTIPAVLTFSNHAIAVGRYMYGNATSVASGITDITGASAVDFIDRYTGFVSGGNPIAQGFHVSNHSYVYGVGNAAAKTDLLRRFDYIVNRDDTVAVVGANNGASNTAPDLWTHSYNAIKVGRSDGLHSFGSTSVYGAGRTIPEIVVPIQHDGATFNRSSFATGVVSASAAVLKEKAGFDGFGNSLHGGRNQTVRALLYAGATKDEFPGWSKTSSQPIDGVYGFGELNLYNSYKMLDAGEQEGFTNPLTPTANIDKRGWDFGNFTGSDLHFNFEVAANEQITELSAVLAWNVNVTDTNPSPGVFTPTHTLANLDLGLYDSSGSFLGSLLQSSVSTLYNFEHIYINSPLGAGNYTFRITGDMPVDYGFAWRMHAVMVPEPSSLFSGLMVTGILVLRRRPKAVVV